MAHRRPHTIIAPPLETHVVVDTMAGERFVVRLAPPMTIGRDTSNEIVLAHDLHAQRAHLRLRMTAEGLLVEDLASTNTTYLSGVQLHPNLGRGSALVHVGDEVVVGTSRITFEHTLAPGPALPADAQRLLAEVCDQPADDAPRMVFADWLMSRGDPRGDFIRFQLVAAGAGTSPTARREAQARADELLVEHELAWIAPLPAPVTSWTFRRGFLDRVWLQPGRDPAALRAHHPLAAVARVAPWDRRGYRPPR